MKRFDDVSKLPGKHRAIRVLSDGKGTPIINVLVAIYSKFRTENDTEDFRHRYTHDRLFRQQLMLHKTRKEKEKGYKVGISDHSYQLKHNPAFKCDFPDAKEIYDFTFLKKGDQGRDVWRIERIK